MRKPGARFAATACSVMARRDHKLAASKNGCVELRKKKNGLNVYLQQIQATTLKIAQSTDGQTRP